MNGVNGTLLRGLQSSWQGMQGAAGRVALASATQGDASDASAARVPTPSRLEADMVDLLAQRNVFQLQLAVFRRADEAQQSLLSLRA
ncbi:MAG: hypothetical protein ACOVQT_17765 [Rubrivivax sp.]|jgi:hypothetical protein